MVKASFLIQTEKDLISPGLGTCECSPPSTGKTSSLQRSPLPKLGSPGNCTHHRSWKKKRGVVKSPKELGARVIQAAFCKSRDLNTEASPDPAALWGLNQPPCSNHGFTSTKPEEGGVHADYTKPSAPKNADRTQLSQPLVSQNTISLGNSSRSPDFYNSLFASTATVTEADC